MKNIISYFIKRKLIFQITNKDEIKKINRKNIKIYCGFDPTNNSLHIGHLIIIRLIKKIIKFNIKVIIIIGGFTAKIGDPSFIKNKRKKVSFKNIELYSNKISNQILNIFKKYNKKIKIINNYSWINKIKINYFLEKICSKINLNNILSKDFIKFRFKNNINLSIKDILYSLLQGYDYLYLNNNYNINLQIGGSDQWGNIITGIDLIKKINNKKNVYGLTTPILTDNNGEKISKTNSYKDSIWLDKEKTEIYKFYQFWINIDDKLVYNYLLYFTDIPLNNIYNIFKGNSYKKYIIGKKIIAKELTKLVHGSKNFYKVLKLTNIVFSKNLINKEENLDYLYKKKFNLIIIKNNINLIDLLIKKKIFKNKSDTKKNIIWNSIKVNKKIVNNIKYEITKKDILYKKYTLISIGKKHKLLIKWDNKS